MARNKERLSETGFSHPASVAGVALVVAALLLVGSQAAADEGSIWRLHLGDEPSFASPQFDDSAWSEVSLPATWVDLGLEGVDGSLWVRTEAVLTERQIELAAANDLGLSVGETVFGSLELFVGGRSVGTSSGWSLTLAEPSSGVFNIPADSVSDSGRVVLAIRVSRVGWASDRAAGGPVGERIELGSFRALANVVEVAEQSALLDDVPYLVLALFFLVTALYHLRLFGRRRRQAEHLWFGLTSLCFSGNTYLISSWAELVTLRADFILRLSSACGHLAAAAAIQFLWPFLSRPISRLLRTYQISHVAIAALVVGWPHTSLVVDTAGLRFLWLVPLMVLVPWLVLTEVWSGNREARTIGLGCLALVVAESHELAVTLFGAPLDLPFSAPPFGFALAVGAMSMSISNRFRRAHSELDALRLRLEEMVRQRTRALRTALKKAEAANEAKSEFLSNISHELRTPLNAIIGLTELLLDSDLEEDKREFVEIIHSNGGELLGLITEILDFSAMENRKIKVARVEFDPLRVLAECKNACVDVAAEKGLILRTVLESGVPPAILGDPARVRRILIHLVGNAVKFTSEGEVVVTLSAKSESGGLWELCFAVSDTGIGIAEEAASKVFESFRQVDGSLTRRYGGAGLGLASCKRLADLMGGDLWFESRVGEGSTFYFKVLGPEPTKPIRRSIAS